MEHARLLDRQLDTLGWGLFFVWWGVTELFKFLPQGIGAIGLGLLLLGLNAVRTRNGIPANGFNTTLGILALVLGGLELAAGVLHLPFEIPIFAILLIVLGMILLGRGMRQTSASE